MNKRLFQTCVAGLMLSAPISSYSYGMMYDDNCCNPCEQTSCCDFTASVDYLYWNVCRSGLDTVIEADQTPILNPGKVHYVDNSWDSGFRVQLGYNCDESTNLTLRYTHFQASPDQNLSAITGGATRLHPALGSSFSVATEMDVDAQYSIKFNVLDIEAGSWMAHGCDSHLRPFLGLRFGWIKQDMDTVYSTPVPTPSAVEAVRQKNDMDSYGVTLGFDFRHNLCDCFNIIGRVAGGAHYGDFSYNTVQSNEASTTPVEEVNVHGCDCRAVYSSEVAVGLEYEFCGFCGSDLTFALGYELHTWHNLMDFQDFPSSTLTTKLMRDESSLLLHGLFIRLGAEF